MNFGKIGAGKAVSYLRSQIKLHVNVCCETSRYVQRKGNLARVQECLKDMNQKRTVINIV
jgi:hypothetical protein